MVAMRPQTGISKMLPRGGVKDIADKLGMTSQAVSKALRMASPGHPAVIEAVRIARESGALETAQALNSLSA